jgi:hypothetical protein
MLICVLLQVVVAASNRVLCWEAAAMMKRLGINFSHLEAIDFSTSKKDATKLVLRARQRREGLAKFKAAATAPADQRSNVLLLHVMVRMQFSHRSDICCTC